MEELPNDGAIPGPRRTGERVIVWGLAAIVLAVTYCWLVRLGNDLTWDEAASLRRYARHPLTAACYLREPNNHPLDSLFRSIFYGVLGLTHPPFWRFAGFLVLAGFLAAAWRWHAFLTARRSVFAATVTTLLLFLSHAIHEQALALRGYFPTIAFQLVYFLLVARWSGLLDAAASGAAAPARRPMTRKPRLLLGALSGLMLFTLPSNAVLMLILWPAAAMAFCGGGRGRDRIVETVRETARLGLTGAACAAILYLPILVTLALRNFAIDGMPVYPVRDVPRAIADQVIFLFQQCQPGPFVETFTGDHQHPVPAPGALPSWIWFAAVGALLAASLAFRRSERPTQVAWWLILATLAAGVAMAVTNETPVRILSPFVGPMLFAFSFLAHDLGSRWSLRTQVAAALLAVCVGLAALPAIVRSTTFDRRGSELAAFLETYTRPAERRVLVGQDGAQTLRPYLHQVFGDAWTMDSLAELRQRLSGRDPAPARASAIERWISDRFFPAPELVRIPTEEVDVLVLVGQKYERSGAVTWRDPALDALKQRLSRMARFHHDGRDVEIYERP